MIDDDGEGSDPTENETPAGGMAETDLFMEMMDAVEDDIADFESRNMDLGANECVFLMFAYLKGYCKEVGVNFNEVFQSFERLDKNWSLEHRRPQAPDHLVLSLSQKERRLMIDQELAPDYLIDRIKIAPLEGNGDSNFKYSVGELEELEDYLAAEVDDSEDDQLGEELGVIRLKIFETLEEHSSK